ncbi:hypothetical protein T484DRAFT_1976250, partial [Baffinella frigidus]
MSGGPCFPLLLVAAALLSLADAFSLLRPPLSLRRASQALQPSSGSVHQLLSAQHDLRRRQGTGGLKQVLRMSGGGAGSCTAVVVYVSVKAGMEEDFKKATLENARNSVQEEGIARFDVIEQADDPTKFVLFEVYKNAEAPAKHKDTEHYLTWRSSVDSAMAAPRTAAKYANCFPSSTEEWDVPAGLAKGQAESSAANLLVVHVFVSVKGGSEEAFKAACLANAGNSVQEEGCLRFDVLQNLEDGSKFCLIEVYTGDAAAGEHKKTAHYAAWAETVKDMMAEPRSN